LNVVSVARMLLVFYVIMLRLAGKYTTVAHKGV
jgi:hypothetical protein